MTQTPADARKKTALRTKQALVGLGVALVAPVLVFIAAVTLRMGVLDWPIAFDFLVIKLAWPLAWLGAAGAVIAVIAAFGAPRRAALPAVAAVVIAGVTVTLFALYAARPTGVPSDVSTNSLEPPAYPSRTVGLRQAAGAMGLDRWGGGRAQCPGVAYLPRQVAPGVAGYALENAGFEVPGFGVGRADGVREGFWFGFTHDAVIRIRPGRTDIRVSAREDRDDRGEACRLAAKILAGLQPSE